MLDNSRVRKTSEELSLAVKALNRLIAASKELEGHGRVGGSIQSTVDDTHAPSADEALDDEPVDQGQARLEELHVWTAYRERNVASANAFGTRLEMAAFSSFV